MKFYFGLIGFGILINVISFMAHAEVLHCDVQKVAKCACKASMTVECKGADGAIVKGLVDDEQKPASVDYVCGLGTGLGGSAGSSAVSGTLAHPKLSTHEYVTADAEFKTDAALHDKPVSSSSQCAFKGFTADSANLKIYQEPEGLNRIDLSGCAWVNTTPGGLFASHANPHHLQVNAQCGGGLSKTSFCAGEISCKGKTAEYRVCESRADASCPTASECYEQATQTGNANHLTVKTFGLHDTAIAGFPLAKLALVKNEDGKSICIGDAFVNAKTQSLVCGYKNNSCGTAVNCASTRCNPSPEENNLVTVSGRVYSFDQKNVILLSSTKDAWRVPRTVFNPSLNLAGGQKLVVEGMNAQIERVPVPKD